MTDDRPIDHLKAPDPVLAVLLNAEKFDRLSFHQWLETQPQKLQRTAKSHPPFLVYELKSHPGKLCFIHGYAKDGHIIIHGIGDPMQVNVHCAPDELRDVTAEVRRERGLSV